MAATGRIRLVFLALVITHLAFSSAWKLVLVHSNDILFQLDEIKGDNSDCFKPLPITTPTPTTSTLTTPTPTTPTPTTPTPTTPTPTTPTPTTPTPTTPTPTTPTPTTPTPTTSIPTDESIDPSETSNAVEFRSEWEDQIFPDAPSEVSSDQQNVANDAFSSLEDFDPVLSKRVVRTASRDVECYGGVARHLTAKNELKNKSENFLYLNAGGMLGGNIWYPILGPAPASEVFSILGYDAVALGHRDFDEGVGVTIEYLRALKDKNVDVLCANIDASEQPEFQALIKKSKVVNLNGNKVGIVGFIGTDAEVIADTGKIKFLDEIESINKEVSSLFEEGVAFIVALGSSDHKKAQNMLEKLFDVDILVSGGGPDVFYYTGNQGPLGEKVTGNYPVVFSNQSKRLFVQTSRYGKYLGVLNVDITEGRIDAFNGNPSLLNSSYTPDANLQEKVDSWEYEVRKQSEEVIGSTKVPLVTGRHVCWYGECAGGNLIADAVRWYLELNETNWRDSISAAVWHGGAMVHTILSETTGSIKFGDILQMFPFANTLSTVRMSGSDVKRLMELSVESYNDSSVKNLGEFLHVSGMRVEFNMSAPAGQRVSRLLIRNTNKAHADWSELDANERYKIGMPSFIARGGSRYSFLEGLDHVDTKIRDEEALKSYIKWTSPLSYGFEERIRLINSTVDPVECKSADIVGTVFLTIFLTLLVVGLFFAGYKFLYPKIRDRSGSVLSLVR